MHVEDLIEAHVLSLEYLKANTESQIFNLGSSTGYSVKEIVEAARKVTGEEIPAKIGERRAGDPAKLVASSEKARETLGWQPKYDNVEDIIQTAWDWHKSNPEGYAD